MPCGVLHELLCKKQDLLLTLTSDARKATEVIARNLPVDLIILHGTFSFCDPVLRSFSAIRASRIPPFLIVIASESSESFAINALRAGALDYFAEPFDLSALDAAISRVSRVPVLDANLVGGEVLVGNSVSMQVLRRQILRVATTDCNVLITGETGTGKELVAQLLHQNSPRRIHTLVCINCAAVPDSLLESELFGYERGSFTGANASNHGKLMSADRGTVFLDEIGEMSAYSQAKILRLIESKEVQRLGSTRRVTTDVRVLAATHHNLDESGSTPTFRRDLYFRLNVGRIHLPPLRERKSDIPDLAAKMVVDLNRKLARRIEGVDDEGMRVLMNYDWPGNVRELKNVIERIFISRDSGRITEDDLPSLLFKSNCENEMQLLRTALISCRWNKSKAAEKLNWSRMTLYRKLVKYGLVDEVVKKGPEAARPHIAREDEGRLA
jgi:DNA-binding NtrC family response regulator